MTDNLTARQRSELMGRIQSRGTGPEAAMEALLKKLGLRFRKDNGMLPGSPDFVVHGPVATALFVHGCFWHRCPLHFRMPKSRRAAWAGKIAWNVKRDAKAARMLRDAGFRVAVVWEHELPRKKREPLGGGL